MPTSAHGTKYNRFQKINTGQGPRVIFTYFSFIIIIFILLIIVIDIFVQCEIPVIDAGA